MDPEDSNSGHVEGRPPEAGSEGADPDPTVCLKPRGAKRGGYVISGPGFFVWDRDRLAARQSAAGLGGLRPAGCDTGP